MRFTLGIQSIKEIEPLSDNGADEFFGGLLIKGLYSNARPSIPQYNLKDLRELEEITSLLKNKNKSFFLVINEPFDRKEINIIISTIEKAINTGVNGFIISSVSLLNEMKMSKINCNKIILSCLGLSLNREAIDFYRGLGVNRIILTRQNKISEISHMTENFNDLEFESFACFDKCNNLDELCRTSDFLKFKNKNYSKEGCLCLIASNHEFEFYRNSKQIDHKTDTTREMINWHSGCGACYLNRLSRAGITSVKFASRGWSLEKKLHYLNIFNYARELINTDITEEEYIMNIRNFRETAENSPCTIFDCYYKEDEPF